MEVPSHFATVPEESPSKQLESPNVKLPTTGEVPSLFLSIAAQLPEIDVDVVRHALVARFGKTTSKWLRPRKLSTTHSLLQIAVGSLSCPLFWQYALSRHASPERREPEHVPADGLQISYTYSAEPES
jgi:hypothetical protein